MFLKGLISDRTKTSHETYSFDNMLFNTKQIIPWENNTQTKAKIENQRTLDMFVISKNIVNDRSQINMTMTM